MEYDLLSTWNQIAPRAYIRHCYCFPFRDDASPQVLEHHLRGALSQLFNYFPYLTKKLSLLSNPPGRLALGPEVLSQIPLEVSDERSSFPWIYERLKIEGFPARAFVDLSFDLPYKLGEGQCGIPILEIRARIIKGGLFLCVYVHHSITDGTGMNNLVNCLAQLTNSLATPPVIAYPIDIQVDLPEEPFNNGDRCDKEERSQGLLESCNEYCDLGALVGPTQFLMKPGGRSIANINKTGRIFVIRAHKIHLLKDMIAGANTTENNHRLPSTFTCLAAASWAHVIRARLAASRERRNDDVLFDSQDSKLLLSVNWRRRAFDSIMESSGGNTIALALASVDVDTLISACNDTTVSWYDSFWRISREIEATIAGIGEDFISQRTSLIRSCQDPRRLGVNLDPRDPRGFYFNTWRHFGLQQSCWNLPGVMGDGDRESDSQDNFGVVPDVIRRTQGDWNLGAGLLLPAGENSDIFELLITLETDAMEKLCADPSWMQWVDRIVE